MDINEQSVETDNQKTLAQLTESVKQGLKIASDIVKDDPILAKFVQDIELSWEQLAGNLVVLAVTISTFRYRPEEEVKKHLKAAFNQISMLSGQTLSPFSVDEYLRGGMH